MVLLGFDQFTQFGFQFSSPSPGQPTLKDRKLKPFSESLHGLVDLSPTSVVGDVVANDIGVFVAHVMADLTEVNSADTWLFLPKGDGTTAVIAVG